MDINMLDSFRKKFIEEVMDLSFDNLEMIIRGNSISIDALMVQEALHDFNTEQKNVLMDMLPIIVGTILFSLLDMVDTNDNIKLLYGEYNLNLINIKEQSDGLGGELFSEDGWISRFSNKTVGIAD